MKPTTDRSALTYVIREMKKRGWSYGHGDPDAFDAAMNEVTDQLEEAD